MNRRELIKAGTIGAVAFGLPATSPMAQQQGRMPLQQARGPQKAPATAGQGEEATTLSSRERPDPRADASSPDPGNRVPRLALGDDASIPVLGYGTWDVRGATGQKAIETALALGYRHIDTAAMYANEDIVGAAVRASGIPREQIFITSKVWSDMSRNGAQRTVEQSLRALGLDYIDLYLLHRPSSDIHGAWDALSALQREGRLRTLGVSNFNAAQLDDFHRRVAIKPVLNQIELNPRIQQHATRRAMKRLGVLTQSYSPFGGGSGSRHMLQDPTLARIASRHGKTAAQVILRWLVQQDIVAIPKTLRPERMQENLAIFDFSLDATDLRALARLDTQAGQHTGGNMHLTIGNRSFEAELASTTAATELQALLPLDLDMDEHAGNEKFAELPRRLSTDDHAPGRIEAGDILLWQGNTLVLFYESFRSTYRYTRLGRIIDPQGLKAALGAGSVRVQWSAA